MSEHTKNILELKNVKTYFPITKGTFFQKITGHVKAVDGVSLSLNKGEVLGLVGESGCGKSTLGKTILKLVHMTEGEIYLNGQRVHGLSEKDLFRVRPKFQMIFQDPYASLNPRMTVFDTLAEPLLIHRIATPKNVTQKVSELMNRVGLSTRFVKKYPHEFSGGQRQRIAIARAIATEPELLIADEPVSALDVSIQSQILNLLSKLIKEMNIAMVFISHDLSVVRYISNRVAVMYLGKIAEIGEADQIFNHPLHPYTKALISAIPIPDPQKERDRHRILLEGDPPSPINLPSGCRFHPRCPYRIEACSQTVPQLETFGSQQASCIRIKEIN